MRPSCSRYIYYPHAKLLLISLICKLYIAKNDFFVFILCYIWFDVPLHSINKRIQ